MNIQRMTVFLAMASALVLGAMAQSPQMIDVPAGTFEMGDPWGEGGRDERPAHEVTLSAYEIGRCEVTNAEFVLFLNSALEDGLIRYDVGNVYLVGNDTDVLVKTQQAHGFSQITFNDGLFAVRTRETEEQGEVRMDDHPALAVNWFGGAAYCNWLSRRAGFDEVYTTSGIWECDLTRNGYHLPTEAQWERAAAWEPDHGHWRYGFMSDDFEPSHANVDRTNPLHLQGRPQTTPVGYYNGENETVDSPSPVGCYDMSGNMNEWCNDWYAVDTYTVDPVTDPIGPASGELRVSRGGDWVSPARDARTAIRPGYFPESRFNITGFRVARNP